MPLRPPSVGGREDVALLLGELVVCEYAAVVQVCEPAQLDQRVERLRRRRGPVAGNGGLPIAGVAQPLRCPLEPVEARSERLAPVARFGARELAGGLAA